MMSESFKAGKYTRQNKSQERSGGSFSSRVTTTEGTRPQSRSRLVEAPQMGNVHRNSVKEFKPHDTNHEPYSTAHRPAPPQTSPTPDGDGLDLGRVTAKQHKQLSDRSRKGKKKTVD